MYQLGKYSLFFPLKQIHTSEECMECNDNLNYRYLQVETQKSSYLVEFSQIQIEITGKCNMLCHHCRASKEEARDMEMGQIKKLYFLVVSLVIVTERSLSQAVNHCYIVHFLMSWLC